MLKMNNTVSKPWKATLTDWCIVLYPQIYGCFDAPEKVFAKVDCGKPVAILGRALNDPRYNSEKGDSFADGHRLITSAVLEFKSGEYYTNDTVYTLDDTQQNPVYRDWCLNSQCNYVIENNIKKQDDALLVHICENCGKKELLTSEEGFNQGWDYPPKIGNYKIISPRTCGDCDIQTTLWWEMNVNKTPITQLSEKHKETLNRILSEPESVTPKNYNTIKANLSSLIFFIDI